MAWYGILYLNQGNTLAPTILSWFPWGACLYRYKRRAHFYGRNGTETLLCDVSVVFVTSLLRFCVSVSFLGKVLDLNKNHILPGKWPRISPAVRRVLFACIFFLFLFFCPIAGFHLGKLKNVGTGSFLVPVSEI